MFSWVKLQVKLVPVPHDEDNDFYFQHFCLRNGQQTGLRCQIFNKSQLAFNKLVWQERSKHGLPQ